MHPRNKDKFDYLNITNYHNAGFKGKNIKILFYDVEFDLAQTHLKNRIIPVNNSGISISHRSPHHGVAVGDILNQILPEAEIYFIRSGGGNSMSSAIKYANDNNMDIFTMSMSQGVGDIRVGSAIYENSKEAYENNIILCNSAGNEGLEGVTRPGTKDYFIAVGAGRYVETENNVEIDRPSYSSVGAAVEVVSLTNMIVKEYNEHLRFFGGTSCACPMFAGCLGLLISTFKNKVDNNTLRNIVRKYCQNLNISGRDPLAGYGIFRLPNPNFVR